MCVRYGDYGKNLSHHPDVIQRLREENRLHILDQEEDEENEDYNGEDYVNFNIREAILNNHFSN